MSNEKKFDISFEYLNKSDFEKEAKAIFDILADNMMKIAPTGNTREEDFNYWYEAVKDGLSKKERQIILIKETGTSIGFFQYYINADIFVMEEIQIKEGYQGANIFRDLYGYIFANIKKDLKFVEAYANKANTKSMAILERMGLLKIGMNKNCNSYHYKGEFEELIAWYEDGI